MTVALTGSFLLKRARVHTECGVCGNYIPKGTEYGLLSGDVNVRTGKLIADTKFCGLCAGMFMPEPANYKQFYDRTGEPTQSECVDIVDSGSCDSGCILSGSDDDGCDCRCAGEYHGALRRAIDALVTT